MRSGVLQQEWAGCQTSPAWLKRKCSASYAKLVRTVVWAPQVNKVLSPLCSVRGQQFAQQIQQQNPELIEQLRNHIRSRSFSGSAEEQSWSPQVGHVLSTSPCLSRSLTCTTFILTSRFSKGGQPFGAITISTPISWSQIPGRAGMKRRGWGWRHFYCDQALERRDEELEPAPLHTCQAKHHHHHIKEPRTCSAYWPSMSSVVPSELSHSAEIVLSMCWISSTRPIHAMSQDVGRNVLNNIAGNIFAYSSHIKHQVHLV